MVSTTGMAKTKQAQLTKPIPWGLALKGGTHPDIDPSMVLERPKVMHNPRTGKFVMWMHIDSADYELARLGVAVSDNPQGPFRYQGSFRPHGQQSRDFTVFADEQTGLAYVAYSSEGNRVMHISALTPDYTRVTSTYTEIFAGEGREAPAMFKHGDVFLMATSGCSGWEPNQLEVFWSRDPLGEWYSMGNPCKGGSDLENELTFFSQPTFVLAMPGLPGTFVFMADQWEPEDLSSSSEGFQQPYFCRCQNCSPVCCLRLTAQSCLQHRGSGNSWKWCFCCVRETK
ncbi:hypothetical protein ABBQ32_000818 [Trebouxia sp. C0010 RCD-2024]